MKLQIKIGVLAGALALAAFPGTAMADPTYTPAPGIQTGATAPTATARQSVRKTLSGQKQETRQRRAGDRVLPLRESDGESG